MIAARRCYRTWRPGPSRKDGPAAARTCRSPRWRAQPAPARPGPPASPDRADGLPSGRRSQPSGRRAGNQYQRRGASLGPRRLVLVAGALVGASPSAMGTRTTARRPQADRVPAAARSAPSTSSRTSPSRTGTRSSRTNTATAGPAPDEGGRLSDGRLGLAGHHRLGRPRRRPARALQPREEAAVRRQPGIGHGRCASTSRPTEASPRSPARRSRRAAKRRPASACLATRWWWSTRRRTASASWKPCLPTTRPSPCRAMGR